MPELAAPAWLLALALVPLVRWLHRFRAQGRELRVPALFLWHAAVVEHRVGPRRGPPDPAWRRRALLVALLALALARPSLPVTGPPTLEVWLDDGPALFARETDGTTRLALAAQAIARALADEDAPTPELRALRRPGERRSPTGRDAQAIAATLTAWLDGPGEGPATPPPTAGDARRWLVSTGADARLLPVLAQTRFQRVVPIGAATENLAPTGLSVRPSLTPPHGLRALVTVLNAGQAPARAFLELRLSDQTLARVQVALQPGATAARGFALPPGAAGRLDAVLLPEGDDGLPRDDRLGLDLPAGAGTTSVAIQGDCPRPVSAFVAANPGLVQRPLAELRIACGTAPPAGDVPTLWLPGTPAVMAPAPRAKAIVGAMSVPPLPDPPPQGGRATRSASGATFAANGEPADALPVWAEDGGNPPALPAGLLRPLTRPEGVDGGVLLAAGEVPLLIEQAEPTRLVLLADLAGAAGRPELPALLDWALSRLAGRDLPLPALATARNPAEAHIAPGPLPAAMPGQARGTRAEAAPWLLAAALLLALYDLRRTAT